VAAALLGCAIPTAHRHQPVLTRAEIVAIAKRCASKHHVRWQNYFPESEINFEISNDYEWGVTSFANLFGIQTKAS
jgi:hypothetical protein